MKIAFVSTILGYPWGGADALWTSAAEHAAARGDRLHLELSPWVEGHPRVRALVAGGARLHLRSAPRPEPVWVRGRRALARRLFPRDALVERLRAFGPDLLIFSCGGTYDPILEPALCAWLRSARVPYRIIPNLQEEHPKLSEDDRARARELLAGADRIYFSSPRNLALTRRQLLHPLPQAECIHGWIAASPPLAWPPSPPWVLACVGRLEPIKGMDFVIAAAADALGREPGWRLHVYGRGPQLAHLQQCAVYCGIPDQVRFLGFVPDVDQAWREAHLLVSGAIDEGVPLALPEALLRGRPALATRVGGADEWIVPGETGFLCPAPTVELLAGTLREAWARRDQWREMGRAAADRSRALYRPDDYRRIVDTLPA